MDKQQKLFLLDVMALIYRAHYALHQHTRTNSKGLQVGPLLGFANSLVEILQKQSPSHVIATFDTSVPTWRKKIYPAYKAQRQVQPEAITIAIPYTIRLLEAFNITCLAVDGYEADDIIGTLCTQAADQDFAVYIVSSDKDLGQLVNNTISLYKPSTKGKPSIIWREKDVLAHWGIKYVTQIPDMLGLCGDSSDNIPGVPNIGPKTAQKLIADFGSIEQLITQVEKLPPSLQKRLQHYEKQALLSKKLATITTDVPLKITLTDSRYQGFNHKLLQPLLAELEFRSLAKRLFSETTTFPVQQLNLFVPQKKATSNTTSAESSFSVYTPDKATYTCLDTKEAIIALVKKISALPAFCFDTETTGLNPHTATLLGIALCYEPKKAFFIPIPKEKENATPLLALLQPIFQHRTLLKVGQNLKYDLLVLRHHGVIVAPPFFDTMIAHHLLLPGAKHNLSVMAKHYLRYAPIEIETLIGLKGPEQKQLDQVPLASLTIYACEDADITFQLYEKFADALVEASTDKLFYTLEMKLLPVLVHMEKAGIALDTTILKKISIDFTQALKALEKKIHTLAGSSFNIASPKQLGIVLFEQLKIVDKPTKTPKGQYATNEIVLTQLLRTHPIIQEILTYRELSKLKSTYVDALPALLGEDARLHTSYHQAAVSTGRLSSTNPNLQNIPIRTERGKAIRKAFVAGYPDYYLLSADYSQIELRIMAHFAQDDRMVAAFEANKDIHAITAAQIFGVSLTEVTSDMRRKAKMVNFGIIYGISPFGLAKRLGIPRGEAGTIIKTYFREFPAIRAYMEKVIEQTKQQGYITTMLGRKRFLPDINSQNATMRGAAERNAINMPIQGTAAELIQKAMIDIEAWLQKTKIPARMVLQVHDELIFEVHASAIPEIKVQVPRLMSNALPFCVPIEVSVGIGKHWLEAH